MRGHGYGLPFTNHTVSALFYVVLITRRNTNAETHAEATANANADKHGFECDSKPTETDSTVG